MPTHSSTPATVTLVAGDIGNFNTKIRDGKTNKWIAEPSIVRTPSREGFSFTVDSTPKIRPLMYLDGPAHTSQTPMSQSPLLVGTEALRFGVHDQVLVGGADMRVRSAAYLLLHFYAVLRSLPMGTTTATINFVGGLPIEDFNNGAVKETLVKRLKGTHRLQWGADVVVITIEQVLLLPQPIAGMCTLLYHPDGKMQTNGALSRMRFVLDIGGGTTDYTCRQGLQLVPGTEGGLQIGITTAMQIACDLVRKRYPTLKNLTPALLTQNYRTNPRQPVVHVGGDEHSVKAEIDAAFQTTSSTILAHIMPLWRQYLEQGELLIFGGGGADLALYIKNDLAAMRTPVTLLDQPLFRVVDGLARFGTNRVAK